MLPCPIDQTWEVTLRVPSWLLIFFGITRGLYLCCKLRLHAYWPAEDKNKLGFQTSFFRQALVRSDLINNQIEVGQLPIIYFWPNQDFIEQGIIHVPAEVILETTAPNTPNNAPEQLPSYQNLYNRSRPTEEILVPSPT